MRVAYDGRVYQRDGQHWYDAKHLRVEDRLAQRLDALARSGPEFGPRDAPGDGVQATVGERLAGEPPRRALPGRGGTREPRAETLAWQFDRGELALAGDAAVAWKERQHSWAYVGSAKVICPEARFVRAQFMLFARGSTVAWRPRVEVPPQFSDRIIEKDGVFLWLSGSKIAARVKLLADSGEFNSALGWAVRDSGNPFVHRQVVPLFRGEGGNADAFSGEYELQVMLVIHPPARRPAPTYYEWQRRFFPGGLPSLGRRG